MGASGRTRTTPALIGLLACAVLVLLSASGFVRLAPKGGAQSASGVPRTFRPGHIPDLTAIRAHDSSGHQNNGFLVGAPQLGVRGHRGAAYDFDDPGSVILVPRTPTLSPDRQDFLYSAWVLLDGTPHGHQTFDIVRKGLSYTATGMYKLEVVDGARIRCTAKDDHGHTARITSEVAGLADRRWHAIGCARVGATWNVLVDGSVASKPVTLGSVSNTATVSIGSKYGKEDQPRGRIDEVRIAFAAPRPGSAAPDVQQGLRHLRSATPVGLWHLDEPARSPAGSPSR